MVEFFILTMLTGSILWAIRFVGRDLIDYYFSKKEELIEKLKVTVRGSEHA